MATDRTPCMNGCGRMIRMVHPEGVKSYNHTGLCRKCYRKQRLAILKADRKRQRAQS